MSIRSIHHQENECEHRRGPASEYGKKEKCGLALITKLTSGLSTWRAGGKSLKVSAKKSRRRCRRVPERPARGSRASLSQAGSRGRPLLSGPAGGLCVRGAPRRAALAPAAPSVWRTPARARGACNAGGEGSNRDWSPEGRKWRGVAAADLQPGHVLSLPGLRSGWQRKGAREGFSDRGHFTTRTQEAGYRARGAAPHLWPCCQDRRPGSQDGDRCP